MSWDVADDDIWYFKRDFKQMYSELEHIVSWDRHEEPLEDLRKVIKEYSEDMLKLLNLRLAFTKRTKLLEEGKRLVDLKTFSKGEMLNNPEIILELDKS